MNGLTTILERAASDAGDPVALRTFITGKRDELEAAADVTAIEELLRAAVSANTIAQHDKEILMAGTKEFARTGARSETEGQPESPPATGDAAEPVPPDAKIPDAPVPASAGTLKGVGTGVSYVAGLVWLVVLYALSTWIAVGSLSSIQFRDDFENKYHISLDQIVIKFEEDETRRVARNASMNDLARDLEAATEGSRRLPRLPAGFGWGRKGQLTAAALDLKRPVKDIESQEGFDKACPTRPEQPWGLR